METWSDYWLTSVNDWAQVIGLISLFLALISGVGVMLTDKEIDRRTNILEETAKRANETLALELKATKEKIAQGDERDKKRDEAARPRGLVASRMPAMLKELEGAPKLEVHLGYIAHDDEAEGLAGQIKTLLTAAAITYASNAALLPHIPRGVVIRCGNDEASSKLATALAQAISIGSVTVTVKNEEAEEGKVSIFVGKKP